MKRTRLLGWLQAALLGACAPDGGEAVAPALEYRAAAAGCAALFPGITPPAGATDQCDATFRGVRRIVRSRTGQRLHVIRVDLQDPDVRVEAVLARDSFGPDVESVRSMAARHRAAVAINSDYFNTSVGPPQGTTAVDGTCYKAHPGRSALLFSRDQRQAALGRFGSWPVRAGTCPSWTYQGVGGGPPIVSAGAVLSPWQVTAQGTSGLSTINGDTDFPSANAAWWSTGRNAYSAAGLSADGRTLYIAACDSCLLVDELAPFLRALGVHSGLKLDSGSATALVYDGQLLGTERQVAESLVVHSARATCPASTEAGCRCFPATGHTVCGRFLSFWEQNGGLPVFGYPISVAVNEPSGGAVQRTQWFERHRFEAHPENARPYDVLLGLLGRSLLPSRGPACTPSQPLPAGAPRSVPETGFLIPAIFDRAYRSQGLEFDGAPGKSLPESLALFGYPISTASGERLADGRCLWTQYFERARFEYHPDLPSGQQVLLGLLGRAALSIR
jgi:hypothetical protein